MPCDRYICLYMCLLQAPEEEEDTDGMTTPNLLEDAHYLEWAGLGFSAEESYRVYVSLSKLQQSKKLATVRFFGKVAFILF